MTPASPGFRLVSLRGSSMLFMKMQLQPLNDVAPALLVANADHNKTLVSNFSSGGKYQSQSRLTVTDGAHSMLAVVATCAGNDPKTRFNSGSVFEI